MIEIEKCFYVRLDKLLSGFDSTDVDEVYEIMDEFFTWGDTDIVLVSKKEVIHVLEQNIEHKELFDRLSIIPEGVLVRIN